MTDKTAPERIWVEAYIDTTTGEAVFEGCLTASRSKEFWADQEYIRADLAAVWQPMETAPKNPEGEAFGPVVLILNNADGLPWPAYFNPRFEWKDRDIGPAWEIPDEDLPIGPEDAAAWMPIPDLTEDE